MCWPKRNLFLRNEKRKTPIMLGEKVWVSWSDEVLRPLVLADGKARARSLQKSGSD